MAKKLSQIRRSNRIKSSNLKTKGTKTGGSSHDLVGSKIGKRRRALTKKNKSHLRKIQSQMLVNSLDWLSSDNNEELGSYYVLSDFPLKKESKKKVLSLFSQRSGGVNRRRRRGRRGRRRNLITGTRRLRTRTASSSSSFQLAQGDASFFLDEPIEETSPEQQTQKQQSFSMIKTKIKSFVKSKNVLPSNVSMKSSIRTENRNMIKVKKEPDAAKTFLGNILKLKLDCKSLPSALNDKDELQSEKRQHKHNSITSGKYQQVSPNRDRRVLFSKVVVLVSPTNEAESGSFSLDAISSPKVANINKNNDTTHSQLIEAASTDLPSDTTSSTTNNTNDVCVTLDKVKEYLERMHNLMDHLEDLLE